MPRLARLGPEHRRTGFRDSHPRQKPPPRPEPRQRRESQEDLAALSLDGLSTGQPPLRDRRPGQKPKTGQISKQSAAGGNKGHLRNPDISIGINPNRWPRHPGKVFRLLNLENLCFVLIVLYFLGRNHVYKTYRRYDRG